MDETESRVVRPENDNAVCSTSADESHSQTWTACFPGTSPSNVPLTQVLLFLLSECRATAKSW
jgi:hypothetical protein